MDRLEQLNLGLSEIDVDGVYFKDIDMFLKKNEYLRNSFEEVSAEEVYNDIFSIGSLQEVGKVSYENHKFNMLIHNLGNKPIKKRIIGQKDGKLDLDYILDNEEWDNDLIITNGLSYAGKNRTSKNEREMYALIMDLDYVEDLYMLETLLIRLETEVTWLIQPTYIVNSGTGFHLYYLLDKPIKLFPETRRRLNNFKRHLTWHTWVEGCTTAFKYEEVQFQNINQGFRMIGTPTKLGKEFRATAFKIGERLDLETINRWINSNQQPIAKSVHKIDLESISEKSQTLSMAEAKEKYPEWYQTRIVEGIPARKYNHWNRPVNRALYDWYKDQRLLDFSVVEGKRYFRILALAIFASKCNIPYAELEKDSFEALEYFNKAKHKEAFTKEDVLAALTFYGDDVKAYPRSEIEKITGYQMPANKRNGLKQEVHLTLARNRQRDMDKLMSTNWRDNNGRKPKKEQVKELLKQYPNSSLRELEKISGISRPTIIKWKKVIDEELI
ncbi:hypothetical protein R2F61_09725 (plasmid) [Mollicutes bacterium LVI A0078]|nr:hypothetical protein RZE84_09490 [Mollicutes bacterium LVI A0075]WOO90045.1 hypothetical protein RZE84_09460 [Mollicutes bacterium LVI A0075]WOO91933.1 hypothetical protein R2F61_09695 [Mollicutes bacterium LVI A0078]WOO91938.1 hypothetical protein R2F61_09725 [Mollicutes bacterium LVI A0078]